MRIRVKICGFKQIEDAVFAAKMGADAVGLVFYPPSPRHVSIEKAAEIVKVLPPFVSTVALFVDEERAVIENVLSQVPIDCIQFHGDETPEECRSYGKRYIKAVKMLEGIDLSAIANNYSDADGLLLDAYHSNQKGGTGNRFDWTLIPKRCELPIILAGGLNAENVNVAVQKTRPYGVDVSSGVESEKGIKDKNKIAAFMTAVHKGDRVVL